MPELAGRTFDRIVFLQTFGYAKDPVRTLQPAPQTSLGHHLRAPVGWQLPVAGQPALEEVGELTRLLDQPADGAGLVLSDLLPGPRTL